MPKNLIDKDIDMGESKTVNVKQNIFYRYTGTIVMSLLTVICRTIFVYKLVERRYIICQLFI
jgi:hypothetical protein